MCTIDNGLDRIVLNLRIENSKELPNLLTDSRLKDVFEGRINRHQITGVYVYPEFLIPFGMLPSFHIQLKKVERSFRITLRFTNVVYFSLAVHLVFVLCSLVLLQIDGYSIGEVMAPLILSIATFTVNYVVFRHGLGVVGRKWLRIIEDA